MSTNTVVYRKTGNDVVIVSNSITVDNQARFVLTEGYTLDFYIFLAFIRCFKFTAIEK